MKKTIKPVMVSLLAMSVLSACGSNSGNNAADNTSSGGNSSGDKVKIEFFQNKTEAKATFDKLVAKFNEANPNIVVTQVNPPDAETVLKTRAAKKTSLTWSVSVPLTPTKHYPEVVCLKTSQVIHLLKISSLLMFKC